MRISHMHFSHMGGDQEWGFSTSRLLTPIWVIASLLIGSCARSPAEDANSAEPEIGTPTQESPTASGEWQLREVIDALTDEPGLVASASLSDSRYVIDVALQCFGGQRLSYTLSFFNTDGNPVPVNWQYLSDESLIIRADDAEPRAIKLKPLRQPNVIVLSEENLGITLQTAGGLAEVYTKTLDGQLDEFAVAKMALAQNLRLKTELMNGQAVVSLNQAVGPLKRVLNYCGADPQILAQGSEATKAAEIAAQEAYRKKLLEGDTTTIAADEFSVDLEN